MAGQMPGHRKVLGARPNYPPVYVTVQITPDLGTV